MKYFTKRGGRSIFLSAEFGLAVIVAIVFLRNFNNVFSNCKPSSEVHQFESFQELIDSLIQCKGNLVQSSQTDATFNQAINNQLGIKLNNDIAILPQCQIDKDKFKLDFNSHKLNTWLNYSHVQFGGKFRPIGCEPIQKVAIVVPYRDRREHLKQFTLYMHQFLPDQLIEYTIYVIEQSDEKPFNRAKLFNVGVEEINKIEPDICCFIFHDVDLLPLDQRNLYMCSSRPRHLSPSVNTLRFRLLYTGLFGGVISMTKAQYDHIGGFRNDMFGWGGEDDDIYRRIIVSGYGIDRTPKQHGVYNMMKHTKAKPNPLR